MGGVASGRRGIFKLTCVIAGPVAFVACGVQAAAVATAFQVSNVRERERSLVAGAKLMAAYGERVARDAVDREEALG